MQVKRRIVDIMANIDNQELEDLLLTEEEERELTQKIDMERIKSNAMSKIQEEEPRVYKNRKVKKYKASIVIAAAMIMILSTTAFASQYMDSLKQFFGQSASIAEDERSPIQGMDTVSGVTMNVEEGVYVGNSGYLVVSFTKEDGTPFPAGVSVPGLELKMEHDVSYMVGQQLLDDNKKLVGVFELDAANDLDGLKARITADQITAADDTQAVEGPWDVQFTISPGKQREQSLNLAIDENEEALSLSTISVSSIGVAIEGKRTDGELDKLPEYTPEVKVIAADGSEMMLHVSSTSTTKSGFQWLYNLDSKNNLVFLGDMDIKSISIDGNVTELK
ncbi:hypothetical protein P4H39_13845 [Paenibacillus lautus]|uniref:hypothetical protein n=1 Tax=Paenibacillus lautus TaxID=1401 RepID=UPI002DBE21AB|nr:hypothetical protein [Paenibacillus lautus]MEC0203720.1 hypothetical protein [Paenibacillus lautus]